MKPVDPPSSSIKEMIRPAGLLTLAIFLVYLAGTCRTIYVGDSGELVAAAATLGIPHPSGYPLYVLLGKLWTLLVPFGSIAWRMSLLSAVIAASTCGFFFTLVRRLGISPPAATVSTLLVAFGPSFWSQANIQRVYSLNAFFVVAVSWAALEWTRSRRVGWMTLAAFLAGLGASNHTFMGVFGVAVGIFAIITEPALLRRPLHLLACVGSGLLGLLPYAYLPLRSRMDPRLDWGNPETFSAFVAVVTRRDFWDRAWMESPADFLVILGDYLHSLGVELFWGGAVLALAGALWGRRRWPVLLPLLGMAANLWVVGMHGSRSDIFIWHRYYIPSYILAALLAAYGLELAFARWGRRALATAVLPLALLLIGYPRYDRSDYRIADEFSRQLLASLPPGSHLAASDDNILFVLIYLHLVEGLRPDINLIMQGVGDAALPALRFDPETDPLFFTHHPNWNLDQLRIVPVGLAFQVTHANAPLPEPTLPTDGLAGADDLGVPKDYLTQNLLGHYHYMQGITFETRDWPRAAEAFRRAMEKAPRNDVLFYNLGLIHRRNGLWTEALAFFEHSNRINPRRLANNKEVRASDRVEETRKEVDRLAGLASELLHNAELLHSADGAIPAADPAAYHQALARLLEQAGEPQAAQGHRLRALEREAGIDSIAILLE